MSGQDELAARVLFLYLKAISPLRRDALRGAGQRQRGQNREMADPVHSFVLSLDARTGHRDATTRAMRGSRSLRR